MNMGVRKLTQLLCGVKTPPAERSMTASPVDVIVAMPHMNSEEPYSPHAVDVPKRVFESYCRLVSTSVLPWSFYHSGSVNPRGAVPMQHAAAGKFMSRAQWDGWDAAVGAALLAFYVLGEDAMDVFHTRIMTTSALMLSMKFARHDLLNGFGIYRFVHAGLSIVDRRETDQDAVVDALIETQATLVCKFKTFDFFARTPAHLVEDWCHHCMDDAVCMAYDVEVALICVRNTASFFVQMMIQGGAEDVLCKMEHTRSAFITALAVASVVHVELIRRSGHLPYPVPAPVRKLVQQSYAAARADAAAIMDACIVYLPRYVGREGAGGDPACGKSADRHFLLCTRRVLQQESVQVAP
jgi:hypothetical protein